MPLHIIIDGYNLIRQSKPLSALDLTDLQLGREALVDQLAAYKKIKRHKITVVFDGSHSLPASLQRDKVKGITIIFSRQGQQADDVIKKMARREKEQALIVSSDLDILRFAESQGAGIIHSPEFEEKMSMAAYMAIKGGHPKTDERDGWKPTTKKKGPKRRLSKKRRKQNTKIKKL